MAKLTKHEYKKSIASVMASMEKNAIPMGAADKEGRRKRAAKDFWYFFNHYLPHYGEHGTPDFHREIISLLEGEHRFTAIAAPRGFAKSTLVSFAHVLWQICTERSKFVVIVSASDDLSRDLAGFIRLELTDNKRLLEDYGELLMSLGAEGDFIAGKTRILARGRKQALRGFRFKQHRPDLIIVDDIEKDDEAASPRVVLKTLDTIRRGLIPSLAPGGRLVLVGTILRLNSAAGTILLSEDELWGSWHRRVYSALMPDGNGGESSLWPSRFSTAYLQEIRNALGPSAFGAEYQNRPTEDEGAMFSPAMIREGGYAPNAPMALAIDPSVDGIKNSDYKAAVLVADSPEGYVVADAVLVQGRDIKFFEALYNLYMEHRGNIITINIESIAFMVYFVRALEDYFKERVVKLPLTISNSSLKKENRISRLVPLFETGKIFFEPEFKKSKAGKLLIEQLLYFPTPSIHDDGPDALDMAIHALQRRTAKTAPMSFFGGLKPWGRGHKSPFGR